MHHSQRELCFDGDYADFSFDIRPTRDFLGELLSHGEDLEVLEPAALRQQMQQLIRSMSSRYDS